LKWNKAIKLLLIKARHLIPLELVKGSNRMKQQDHLSKDEVIRAVVDECGLSRARRDHLVGCGSCLNECSHLKGELNSFTAMASTLVPPVHKTVTILIDAHF
jgi:hypothetical protein